MLVSTDGGDSFSLATPPATGVTGATVLPKPHGWPNLPGGSFRLVTVPTACVFGQTVTVAWDDFRDGVRPHILRAIARRRSQLDHGRFRRPDADQLYSR